MVGEGNKANVGKRWQTITFFLEFGGGGGGQFTKKGVCQKRCLPKMS